MDAPKGRYRVVEKDGRLIVIDNQSGAPASPSMPSPRASGRPGVSSQPVIASGTGAVDSIADHLVALAVRKWDGEGRAIVHWRWKENGREKVWDAALDKDQQRRLGRGLLALCTAPLFVLLVLVVDLDVLALPAFALMALPLVWGIWTIRRLMADTGARLDESG
jgi:hypothetical protein